MIGAARIVEWIKDQREKTLWRLHCSENILQVDVELFRNSRALIAKTRDRAWRDHSDSLW
jgi:hypothetical protein